ncbi:MAG TPA: hypothetical protein VF941_15875 [Clostridia bacterium]
MPPTIIRHRPDAMGVKENGQICIGEAKTENDILNARTYAQLRDFANLELNGMKCAVYIGVPKSIEKTLLRSLEKNNLHLSNNITILYVPDDIINE